LRNAYCGGWNKKSTWNIQSTILSSRARYHWFSIDLVINAAV
jgi:hypothetical protein